MKDFRPLFLVCLLTTVMFATFASGNPSPAASPAGLRLAVDGAAPWRAVDTAALDLALEDERYLPVALLVPEDTTARVHVEIPTQWRRQIAAWREDHSPQRVQLLEISDEPVAFKTGEPPILWLRVSSQGKPAGEHRIVLRVTAGEASAVLTLALHIWPVSLAGAERPFHVRGYGMLPTMTGGYEVNEQSIKRLDAFYEVYAAMGGDVLDWTVNWVQVLPHIRIAGTARTLKAPPKEAADPLDLERLPPLDFSYFDPWFDVARRRGVTRCEAHLEHMGSERWQWALDGMLGKGKIKAGSAQAERIAIWIYRELKRHLEGRGFHGFFCKVSDEIAPEEIPAYLETARVARAAGWRPFTTITGMIPRTAELVNRMNPLCDQWQLGFKSRDPFFNLLRRRYALSESTLVLEAKWGRYTNGGAEHTWAARDVFGSAGLTGIPPEEVESLTVLEDGKPLAMSGGSPWGNKKQGLAITAGMLGKGLYLSPSDGREPREHRIELKIVRRREDPAGRVLAAIDPGDEIWTYGGPHRPDMLPYYQTWSLPAMTLHGGLQGFGQWAFQWWKEDHCIVWMDSPSRRITLSPAYLGFHDGWRDAVLFKQFIDKAGRAEYDKIIGPQDSAVLRVAPMRDPTYPATGRDVPSVTTIANAGDFQAVNAARRQALKILAQ